MGTIMGIDFGTTNSALALNNKGSVRVANINNLTSDERTLRSVLLMNKKRGAEVGQKAVDQYIRSEGKGCRFLQSLKAFLPDSGFTGTTIFGKSFEIEDLVAFILTEVKRIGEQKAGHSIDRAVLGRPVFFSEDTAKDRLAESRLRIAAIRAGISDISFEYEPIAATLAYLGRMDTNTEETVLMGDFGGGTSDFTVMRLRSDMPTTQEEKRKRILSMGGVYIGGDTFDSRIMWEKLTPYFGRDLTSRDMKGSSLPMPLWIMHTLCEWHMIPFLRDQKTLEMIREIKRTTDDPRLIENLEHLVHENKGFSVFQAIEKAKTKLSTEMSAVISYSDRHIHLEEPICRTEFESFIAKDLNTISDCVVKTLSDAHISTEGIDKVLLTGGSSFVPAVRHIFTKMFGEHKLVHLDAFTSVAHGLALSASFH
ncbi:TPA: Hsp70 family protein [Candidatus Woesearchaeota archaeon]|nr:Hsp70 family protein [Candidatus Woesearchaeota archaeon]